MGRARCIANLAEVLSKVDAVRQKRLCSVVLMEHFSDGEAIFRGEQGESEKSAGKIAFPKPACGGGGFQKRQQTACFPLYARGCCARPRVFSRAGGEIVASAASGLLERTKQAPRGLESVRAAFGPTRP